MLKFWNIWNNIRDLESEADLFCFLGSQFQLRIHVRVKLRHGFWTMPNPEV